MKKNWCFLGISLILLVCVHTANALDLKALQEELHKRGYPWVAGETEVSGLSWEEKQKLCNTIPPVFKKSFNEKTRNTTKKSRKAPSDLDWRNVDGHDWMTQPKSQGQCGSCWCFGAIGAFEARLKIANNEPDDRYSPNLSEQFVVSCDMTNYGCNGGSGGRASQYLVDVGVTDEACYPYIAKDRISGAPCGNRCTDWESRITKAIGWGSSETITEAVKEDVAENGPVIVIIDIKEDFFYYKSGIYEPIMGRDVKEAHSVVLCGWSPSAWLIKNSWGSTESQFQWRAQAPTWPIHQVAEKAQCVNLDTYIFNDPDNGVWDPGETIDILTTLKAKGQNFTNVVGTLSTTDSYITITDATFNFGSMTQDGTSSNSTPFKATATSGTSAHDVLFTLHVTADGGYSRDISITINIGYKDELDAPITYLYGLAFDGANLWGVDWRSTNITKINAATGIVLGQIPTPTNDTMCTGIAWDGTNLWVHSCNPKRIYKVNPSNGAVITSFNSPATQYPTGLTFDGTNLWAVDRNAHEIYEITTSGTVVSLFPIPVPEAPLGAVGARGLAFEPKGPDGGSLILYYTWFSGSVSDPTLDSTCIYEITRSGSLVSSHHKRTPEANGRAVEVHPYAGKYWVNTFSPAKVYRIDGFYQMGTEEILPKTGEKLDMTISPNPFRDNVSINFCTPNASRINISIYDIAGKLVRQLTNRNFKSGKHEIAWNSTNKSGEKVPYGIYFVKLKANNSTCISKTIVLK